MTGDPAIANRLKIARERRYESATEAAEAMGVRYPTYAAHENATRGLTTRTAKRYAEFFRVPLTWLLEGTGDADFADILARKIQHLPPLSKQEVTDFIDFLASRRKR